MNPTEKQTSFYTMIVPSGAVQQVAQSYEGNWLSDSGIAVVPVGDIDLVSVRVGKSGILDFYKRLRKAANHITELYVDAVGVGMERNPTIDRWGQLHLMEMNYKGEPMKLKVVCTSGYAY